MTKTVFRVLGVVASVVVGGAASAADAPAVEWKVSDGGNGHWYSKVPFSNQTWTALKAICESKGGYLATITSSNEQSFLNSNVIGSDNCLLGGLQDHNASDYAEPAGGWKWITGESMSWTNWAGGEPNNYWDYGEDVMGCWHDGVWVDLADRADMRFSVNNALIEYSADCNGDGSVDYGQIQSAELADTNNNGVPDVCEPHVTYVQPISGPASGGTAVNINGVNFPNSVSVLFGGVAATDVVVVSPILITAVTPVGVPGMTVVTVNGIGGEAFYYRSNCQSDLDGSGGVDSSDLGILLLDFGSCGETAAVAPQPEPLILQTLETPTPVLNKK